MSHLTKLWARYALLRLGHNSSHSTPELALEAWSWAHGGAHGDKHHAETHNLRDTTCFWDGWLAKMQAVMELQGQIHMWQPKFDSPLLLKPTVGQPAPHALTAKPIMQAI